MPDLNRRCTIYMDEDLHRALRIQSAETGRSISELVDEAVRHQLTEDSDDLEAIGERAAEPVIPFDEVVKELERLGKL